MAHTQLAVEVSGRIDGRIRRLAAESEVGIEDVVRQLLSPARVTRLEELRPHLALWGYGKAGWRRKVTIRTGLDPDLYGRLRAIATASEASISDVARYLLTGGRTNAELDVEARSSEPLEP